MNEPITEQLYNKVVNFVNKMDGSVRFDYISKSLRIPPDTLDEIVDRMIADGVVVNTGTVGEYLPVNTHLPKILIKIIDAVHLKKTMIVVD
ncbi:hypothetical protein DM052_24830 [Klebsiella pneumoniae]|nr:hypothetical protein [Klebsiella pneumoniae]